jgi:hypothetical protein
MRPHCRHRCALQRLLEFVHSITRISERCHFTPEFDANDADELAETVTKVDFGGQSAVFGGRECAGGHGFEDGAFEGTTGAYCEMGRG